MITVQNVGEPENLPIFNCDVLLDSVNQLGPVRLPQNSTLKVRYNN